MNRCGVVVFTENGREDKRCPRTKVFRGEEVITRAILEAVGKPHQRVAYFTRGHGESSRGRQCGERLLRLRRLLEDRNLMVSNIDLSVQESIPKDAKLLIIAGPKATFLDKSFG